jgi:hypothetical protein
MPSVLPSREMEWQLAQVGRPSITVLLLVSFRLRMRHLIFGSTESDSGWMMPRSRSEGSGGINGTSR